MSGKRTKYVRTTLKVRKEVVKSPLPFAWMVQPHGNESLLVQEVLALCYSSFSCVLLPLQMLH